MARKPPVLPPEITLGALIAWLQSENVSGLIIGGVAASLLGRPRFTRDVDVLILLDDDRWEKFLEAGDRFGFVPRIDNAVAFARRSRVFLVHHKESGIDVDIALAGLPFEAESIEQAKWRKVGNLTLPLPTPENLIIMKAIAHRPQDMADIKSLVDANPKLDLRRVRRWVKEFSTALDMPDILFDLEKLLRGKQTRKRR
ncbi:MAG: hypothetical protein E6J54_10530 [Deltaproteobacteria bacterium]|nr:MAG: hypothetical protein E6J54_10530 [Deltaproteobacteria bacterium]